MIRVRHGHFLLASLILSCSTGSAEPAGAHPARPGIALENYAYPFPVHYLNLRIERQDVRMAYVDVKPKAGANGKTVVLMHGKNFFGTYWADTIALQHARLVAPENVSHTPHLEAKRRCYGASLKFLLPAS